MSRIYKRCIWDQYTHCNITSSGYSKADGRVGFFLESRDSVFKCVCVVLCVYEGSVRDSAGLLQCLKTLWIRPGGCLQPGASHTESIPDRWHSQPVYYLPSRPLWYSSTETNQQIGERLKSNLIKKKGNKDRKKTRRKQQRRGYNKNERRWEKEKRQNKQRREEDMKRDSMKWKEEGWNKIRKDQKHRKDIR